jgi:hypothetical protein
MLMGVSARQTGAAIACRTKINRGGSQGRSWKGDHEGEQVERQGRDPQEGGGRHVRRDVRCDAEQQAGRNRAQEGPPGALAPANGHGRPIGKDRH